MEAKRNTALGGDAPDAVPHPAPRVMPDSTRWLWRTVLVVIAALLHLLQDLPYDGDTAYHLAVARLIREHGFLQSFPWTPFSWLADHYADKELLFHLLLVPVATLPLAIAAKIAGTIATGAVLITVHEILVGNRVERAGLWTLLLLLACPAFVFRIALVRPHVVAISLALWLTYLLAERRLRWIFVVSVLYPLSYVAWHTAVAIAVLVELARVLARGRSDWRPLASVMGGLAVGLLVHPNFPNILTFFWVQNVEILMKTAWAGKAGFDLGREFGAMKPGMFFLQMVIPVGLLLSGAWRGWRDRTPVDVAFLLVALAFIVLSARTERFIEYAAPFTIVAAALWWRRQDVPRLPVFAAMGALVLHGGMQAYPIALLRSRVDAFPPPMRAAVETLIPEGAQVFTCSWHFTGEMLLALPNRRFMVALDPVLFFYSDPERYQRWFDLVRNPPPDVALIIQDTFNAPYVLCETWQGWLPFLGALDRDPHAEALLHSPLWNVYRLRR